MDYLVHLSVSEEIDNREADSLTGNIIGAAIDVHRALGQGFLESAYETCLVNRQALLHKYPHGRFATSRDQIYRRESSRERRVKIY